MTEPEDELEGELDSVCEHGIEPVENCPVCGPIRRIVNCLVKIAVDEHLVEIGLKPPPVPVRRRWYLYRHFDANGALLYIGVTMNPKEREQAHRRESSWYRLIARREEQALELDADAFQIEAAAIRAEKPIYNGLPKKRKK